MAELAISYAGVDAFSRSADYLDLVGPTETPTMRRDMLGMWGCGLVVRGLWRLMGVEHEILSKPYKNGYALADVETIARSKKDAFVKPRPGLLPGKGDVVMVCLNNVPPEQCKAHVFVITSDLVAGPPVTMTSIDGGQTTGNGYQKIEARDRKWRRSTTGWLDTAKDSQAKDDAPFGITRPVQWWVDVTKLGADPERIYG
jgi:hypothetical protein